ncbi:SIR2 family protein [Bradyrhizobium sp. SZCCHNS30051]|uniref:SIR2 family protein n=1 Tax=Bradyrhizobium sp. SZCCHNS30051 TaxID=3057313 RepID=UPI002915EA8D|nr:SIR2 family protein [Bradyrhizobium sp. SZCCHNS30051]
MKFIETSPDIPNELIHEVNDGEVVFLCGAGVSRGANLPLFQELTDRVYEKIGESFDNEPAERIAYRRAEYDRVLRSLEKRTLLPGTDSRVREAVAEVLAPPPTPDLSRHVSLLTLSRDKSGRPRLLTTNFDTLFERAARADGVECRSHAAQSLLRPGTPGDHGILHLHGRLGDRVIGLDQSDLILTSADFGDAYLRDGWASQYVEDRMRVNTLVLVGYQAEDSALRLLLETLDADRERFRDLKNIYSRSCD